MNLMQLQHLRGYLAEIFKLQLLVDAVHLKTKIASNYPDFEDRCHESIDRRNAASANFTHNSKR